MTNRYTTQRISIENVKMVQKMREVLSTIHKINCKNLSFDDIISIAIIKWFDVQQIKGEKK